eukprot:669462-Prorocentrum_minimum.AAC.1
MVGLPGGAAPLRGAAPELRHGAAGGGALQAQGRRGEELDQQDDAGLVPPARGAAADGVTRHGGARQVAGERRDAEGGVRPTGGTFREGG